MDKDVLTDEQIGNFWRHYTGAEINAKSLKAVRAILAAAEPAIRADERERCATHPIDYKAAIAHCYATLGHQQGTKGCVAFARGAEWSLEQLRAIRTLGAGSKGDSDAATSSSSTAKALRSAT